MTLSVSSYSFQAAINAGKMTQLDTVRVAAQIGFDGIEFTDLTPGANATTEQKRSYAEQIRQAAAEHHIAVTGYSVGASLYQGDGDADAKEVERIKAQVDLAKAMGAPVLRHDVVYDERRASFAKMLPTIAENARIITEYAKQRGIRTCTENHGYVAQDPDRMEQLYHAVGHENYGLLVDIGNFACVDADSALAVSCLAPYAISVHAKDFVRYPFGTTPPKCAKTFTTRACNRLAGCVIGEGDIPVRQCLAILKRAGYDGTIAVEYEGEEDCLVAVPRALSNLRRLLQDPE